MPVDLKSIKGIGVEIEKKLLKISIDDVDMLRAATETPEKRKVLSKKINVSMANLYIWAKQAELMMVEGISVNDAALLVKCGIRNIDDLKNADTVALLSFINTVMSKTANTKRIPTFNEINLWKKNAEAVVSSFQKDEADQRNEYIFLSNNRNYKTENYQDFAIADKTVKESGFFSDLSQVITEIGVGIAGAQHQLDLSSIEIQNAILENEELAAYGINATWYTIPEVNFNLKMEYIMMQESSESGSVSGKRKLFISPSNAKYNNFFKSSITEESSLSLRFVPLPPPERFTERIVMPNLIGMSKEEAEEELDLKRISIKSIDILNGKTGNEKSSEVTYQSINPGKIVLINEKLELKVTLDA